MERRLYYYNFDYDTIYDKNLLTNLVTDYEKYKCVINYRGFTPKINKFEDFDYEFIHSIINHYIILLYENQVYFINPNFLKTRFNFDYKYIKKHDVNRICLVLYIIIIM